MVAISQSTRYCPEEQHQQAEAIWPGLAGIQHVCESHGCMFSLSGTATPTIRSNVACWQVYSMQQARRDIDAVYSMGLFDDVKFLPQPSEDSSLENPTVDLTLQVKERKNGGLSAGCGISAQVRLVTQAAPPGVHCTVFADSASMKLKGCCTQDLSCLFA